MPFQGDRVDLPHNPKWKKNATETGRSNVQIIWADTVLKVNRTNGKVRKFNIETNQTARHMPLRQSTIIDTK